MTAPPLT